MGKIKNIAVLSGCLVGGVSYIILSILGFVLHVWTIIIAFLTKGLLAAIISAALPVLAQIYWGIKIWSVSGTFFNPYCLAISVYVVLWIIVIATGLITSSAD